LLGILDLDEFMVDASSFFSFCTRPFLLLALISPFVSFVMYDWLCLVAGADLLLEKNTAGWLLILIWCERKSLLAGWLTNQLNSFPRGTHIL